MELDQTPQSAKDTASLFAEAMESGDSTLVNGLDPDTLNDGVRTEELTEETLKILEKDALVEPSPEDFDLLVDRLHIRLREGRGECIYEVGAAEHADDAGITEDEMKRSEATLRCMAEKLNAEILFLRTRKVAGQTGTTSDYLIRVRADPRDFVEVRVAVVGNVDAGKSTLLGVLTHGWLDNGRGQARLMLFRHKHEIESGRTSSVGNDILGFDAKGEIVNNPDPHDGHLDWVRLTMTSV